MRSIRTTIMEVSVRLALPHTKMVKKSHAMIAATGMIGAICHIFVEESKVLHLLINITKFMEIKFNIFKSLTD